ncbi:hypothetical protein CSUI_003095 [Cystoisospora suis]|uniref:Uncharacterized protein n=1 Tax=Cystoisospora suis TaxID=483139 RepID=A0A2C6L3Y5_9APIC|nr:hypothetical protein CSUI_003095 [Cystoisospora suis]
MLDASGRSVTKVLSDFAKEAGLKEPPGIDTVVKFHIQH